MVAILNGQEQVVNTLVVAVGDATYSLTDVDGNLKLIEISNFNSLYVKPESNNSVMLVSKNNLKAKQ